MADSILINLIRKAGFLGFYKQFQNESSKQTVTQKRFVANLPVFTFYQPWGFIPVRNNTAPYVVPTTR
jgi:hypothetical protein